MFEGNKAFSHRELLAVTDKCLATDPRWKGEVDSELLEYCLHKLQAFLTARGHLQASIGKPQKLQSDSGQQWVVQVNENALYRLGEVRIEGSKLLSAERIRELLKLKTGDIADGELIGAWLFESVSRVYKNFGYLQYASEVVPEFFAARGATEGIVNLKVTVDEGDVFLVRSIRFEGNGNMPEDDLLRELTVRTGDVFNHELFSEGLKRITATGQFDVIDVDKDVDYRCDGKTPQLDLTIRVKRRP